MNEDAHDVYLDEDNDDDTEEGNDITFFHNHKFSYNTGCLGMGSGCLLICIGLAVLIVSVAWVWQDMPGLSR